MRCKVINCKVTPTKLNLVASLVRGCSVHKALNILYFCKKNASYIVRKALISAIANAENNNDEDIDSLYIKSSTVGSSIKMKRVRFRAKGRTAFINKKRSSYFLELGIR